MATLTAISPVKIEDIALRIRLIVKECSLMAEMNLLKWLYGKSGSESSRKNNFSAPVMT